MGRSNTLPLSQPHGQRDGTIQKSDSTVKYPTRSATVLETSRKSRHHLPHIPFVHNTNAPEPSFRPTVPQRQDSVQTRYMSMLLALDTIPRMHNILISFFCWLLLAGFIIFPGTFTSLSSSFDGDPSIPGTQVASQIFHSIKNIQLLIIAGICCGIGAGGMLWLWWRWQANYVWLLNRIFLPGCLNSLAGLISTLINVYSQQGGNWSITARVTAIVTGSIMVITGFLFGLYNFWILEKVKRRHGREWGRANEANGSEGEVCTCYMRSSRALQVHGKYTTDT